MHMSTNGTHEPRQAGDGIDQEVLQHIEDIRQDVMRGVISPTAGQDLVMQIIDERPRFERHQLLDGLRKSPWHWERMTAMYYERAHR